MTTRHILAFDASTPRTVIALGRTDSKGTICELLAQDEEEDAPNQASDRLIARLEGIVNAAGLRMQDLGGIACGRGPGTFTGSRVAVATAKGLALGLNVEVAPVSTLASLAMTEDPDGGGLPAAGLVVSLLDARRGEVHAGAHVIEHGDDACAMRLVARIDERCAPLPSILEQVAAFTDPLGARFVGPGVAAQRDVLRNVPTPQLHPCAGPSAAGLWRASVDAIAAGHETDPADLEAVYLRASYAELGINRPKRPFVRSPFV